jgi:hypothetical protein
MLWVVFVSADYFAAPSDQAAVAVGIRGPAARFDTVRTDIGPEMMVALEELLTGVSYKDNTPDVEDGRVLLSHADDELVVVGVAPEAQATLAEADDDRLAELAVRWVQVEELGGRHDDADLLLSVLTDLRELARRANENDHRLYCWMCL